MIRIVEVDKRAEFVDIRNEREQAQDLGGWVLVSERGDQYCTLGDLGDTVKAAYPLQIQLGELHFPGIL